MKFRQLGTSSNEFEITRHKGGVAVTLHTPTYTSNTAMLPGSTVLMSLAANISDWQAKRKAEAEARAETERLRIAAEHAEYLLRIKEADAQRKLIIEAEDLQCSDADYFEDSVNNLLELKPCVRTICKLTRVFQDNGYKSIWYYKITEDNVLVRQRPGDKATVIFDTVDAMRKDFEHYHWAGFEIEGQT